MEKLGRRILQNPDYLLKNPRILKKTRGQRIGEMSKNTMNSHLALYPEACFGFAGEGTASPWSEPFPEALHLLSHRS